MLMILAMSLLDGGSEIFETWKDPVLEILIYIYIVVLVMILIVIMCQDIQ